MLWVTICKRTDDPKLTWIEVVFTMRGIPHRRNGFRSFHADATLEVPAQYEQAAWDVLAMPAPSRYRRWYKTIDDMPDDHRYFWDEHDEIGPAKRKTPEMEVV